MNQWRRPFSYGSLGEPMDDTVCECKKLSPDAIAMLTDVMGQIVLKPAGIPVYQEIMAWLQTQVAP